MRDLRAVAATLPNFDILDEDERHAFIARMTPDQARVLEIVRQCGGDRELAWRLLASEGLA